MKHLLYLSIYLLSTNFLSANNFIAKSNENILLKGTDLNIEITNSGNVLWKYQIPETGKIFSFAGPTFEIDGKILNCDLSPIQKIGEPLVLNNGVVEYVLQAPYKLYPDLFLRMTFRIPDTNPVIRFRYELIGLGNHKLTKTGGVDNIQYLKLSVPEISKIKEVKLSEFNEMVHSFCLSEREMDTRNFNDQTSFMGPIVVGGDDRNSFLLAYEHGSQAPDMFLKYNLSPDKTINLTAVKGNYSSGF
jgi:hypothetical protein